MALGFGFVNFGYQTSLRSESLGELVNGSNGFAVESGGNDEEEEDDEESDEEEEEDCYSYLPSGNLT